MKEIGKKGILLLVSVVLLCCVLLYMSFAWYTKMTSIGGMDFKAAKWDFAANYEVGDFAIDVNSYEETTINPKLAAPGTEGSTGLTLRSENSDTAVSYVISVDKSTMAQSFQDRIFFYYIENGTKKEFSLDGANKSVLQGQILPNGEQEITIYWRWAYDYDEVLEKTDKVQHAAVQVLKGLSDQDLELFLLHPDDVLDGQALFYNYFALTTTQRDTLNNYKTGMGESFTSFHQIWSAYCTASEADSNYATNLQSTNPTLYGVIQVIKSLSDTAVDTAHISNRDVLFNYEDRVLSGEALFTNGVPVAMPAESRTKLNSYKSKLSTTFKAFWESYLAKEEEHNQFDTIAGSNTQLYESQMSATVTVTGEQVTPIPKT